ncbi:MAG: hypothetical protein SF052_21610 [Bacteroidia bacterium]|nr:hypothetical protein [Bacteroidia bacterium]
MRRLFLLGFYLFTLSPVAFGQGTYEALNLFINTPFFDEFLEMRKRSEDAVKDFKAIQYRYSEEDIAMLRDHYNASAEYFNRALINIKDDMLDKDKRKYIATYPLSYSKQVETDLRRAKEYYENTFQKEIAQITGGEITGTAFLTMLPTLLQYGKTAFAVVQKIQAEIAKFNESLLQVHFYEKYRFRTWDEIE